ncbi:hypothetical protein B5F37_04975 [Drancourtella sp. An210]|nr:hypothetical protein B5F37_04975 [Drancourtella sp. An210]
MKRPHTIFVKLMMPICAITILLLLSASITVSRIYTNQTENAAVSSNLEILNQTDTSLTLVHDHMARIALDIESTPSLVRALMSDLDNITEEWKARQNLSQIFYNMPAAMVDYEVVVAGKNGIAVGSGNGGVSLSPDDLFSLPVFRNAIQSGYMEYGGRRRGFTFTTQNTPVIYGCKALTNTRGETFGALILLIQEESLRQFYQSFSNKSTNILLMSSEGEILSSNIVEDIGANNFELLKTAKENKEKQREVSHNFRNSIVLSRYMVNFDAYVISQITSSILLKEFWPRFHSILVICSALLVLLLVSFLTMRKNLLPLRTLADHMEGAKGIPERVSISQSKDVLEIQRIADAYNRMINSLNDYMKEIEKAHEKRRQDELNLLQMQINPHFLYNTLDSVKHMVEMRHSSEACQTIDSLIFLFRSTLNKMNAKVTVSDELMNIRNYISIISPRYGGLIQADAEAMEDCLNVEIPNLILQPFVENAFFHAFQRTKSGSIHIFIYQNEGKLFCDITDTGDGMPKSQVDTLLRVHSAAGSGSRIGISNVRERLALLYPGENSFEIISEPGYGTHIMLSFPAKKKDPFSEV